ncbi:MAG: response regulator transcription factor [Trueperaceae bacterium]|nr:response regulator transcription factor [Trueperaceae bacterium]
MIHVAIVDDHAVVRAGLEAVLARADDVRVAGVYADGAAFLDGLAQLERLDVVLLDVSMPGRDGFDVLRRLRERRVPPAVVLLTMHAARTHARHAHDLGAQGYLTKDASDVRIVHAVRTVAWGGTAFEDADLDEGAGGGASAGDPAGGRAPAPEGFAALSEQEMRVMRLTYLGLGTTEVARDLGLSPKTVSTYKTRIMAKLGVANLIELIRYAEAVGFRVD